MFHFAWVWLFTLLPLPWIIRYALPEKKDTAEGVLIVPFYHRLVASRSEKKGKQSFQRGPAPQKKYWGRGRAAYHRIVPMCLHSLNYFRN